DHFHFIIIFLKLQDVLNGSTTKRINALRIITYHTNIFVHSTKQFNDLILCRVGILVFINKYVFKFMLVLMKYFWKMFQQFVHLEKKIIKIHCSILKTTPGISIIYLSNHGPVSTKVFLLNMII